MTPEQVISLIGIILWVVGIYLSCGLLFAIYFFALGQGRFGEPVTHAKWGFRVIIVPSMIGLWPWLLRPLFGVAEVPLPTRIIRNLQGFTWALFLILVPVCVLILLSLRTAPPVEADEVQQIQSLITTSH